MFFLTNRKALVTCYIASILLIGCEDKQKVVDRWENGQPKETRYYLHKEDLFHFIQTRYYQNGNLRYKGELAILDDTIKIGEWNYYYDNGGVRRIVTYREGRPFGQYQEFFKNGTPKEFGSYDLEGRLQGDWKSFNQNGALLISGNYDHGVKVYSWVYNQRDLTEVYYNNGTLKYSRQLIDSGLIFQKNYYLGGITCEGYMIDGKPDSFWTFYYPNCHRKKDIIYLGSTPRFDNYKLINYWDTNGVQLVHDGNGEIGSTVYKDGFSIEEPL